MWIYRYHPYMGDMSSPVQRGHAPYHQMQQEMSQEEMMQTSGIVSSKSTLSLQVYHMSHSGALSHRVIHSVSTFTPSVGCLTSLLQVPGRGVSCV